ncbi:MAG: hypothetical protein Q9216_006497 [Gyalolechia sp. 2 TL-2023]
MYLSVVLTLLLIVHFTITANPSVPDAQKERVTLPTGLADGPSTSTVAVQIANQTLTAGRKVSCFVQRKPSEEQIRPIKFMDCYAGTARGLLLGDDVMLPTRWKEDMVPFAWNAGTCSIILDEPSKTPGNLQKAEIAHFTAIITKVCVTNNMEPLGGQMFIGNRDQFALTVWGRKWPLDD